ncbi:protein-tyrosine phosphatase-like protein [Colletotrichum godetiae]|uniref:Protein-tyrosine phosphatase-like protein n=1 Tax=Colletotrichum godetiae TaxID=1209918 RepID=A0AAJ0AR40_9PEZI|nr:protein-tyrosine phosphatase-like protein [Colletotrichum godetiae]KAK1688830.1 protein-tyrosine phosphatase-like protein [Colletotrichum godetiae]
MSRHQSETLTTRDVRDPIPPEILQQTLSAPPFIPIPGLINIRDLGAVPGSGVRPGLVYRCGMLEAATQNPQALKWLAANVKHVFDVRTSAEREKHPDPEVNGVANTWLESAGVHSPPDLDDFVEAGGEVGLRKEYLKVLDLYGPIYRAILEHVRDRPEEPFLFHCTAGRDRTGVMAGLLQSLAGTAPEDVRFDYMLSRIGTEPARGRLLQQARAGGGSLAFEQHPGFYNLCSLRTSCWDAFVAALQEVHSGWEGYILTSLGFSTDDLARIKNNLRGDENSGLNFTA